MFEKLIQCEGKYDLQQRMPGICSASRLRTSAISGHDQALMVLMMLILIETRRMKKLNIEV